MSVDSTPHHKPLIAAALGQKPSRTPVWFMRQAGRYLPEYRDIRKNVSFVELCQSPKLAAEVTLQPLRRYDLDAAIIFSDILIPCIGMGQELTFDKGHGPRLSPPVRTRQDLEALKSPTAEAMFHYLGEAIVETKKGLSKQQTMIGFAGAPFTVATYMIEGQGSKTYAEIKRLLFSDPRLLKDILGHITETTKDYLKLQVEAGADALMLFDTWAAQLLSTDYAEHVLPHVKELASTIRSLNVPIIYYPGQGSQNLEQLGGLDVDVISVDWRVPLERAGQLLRTHAKLDVTLQGNLDPQVLIGEKGFVQERTHAVLQAFKESGCRQHIFNVGHGLLPHIPPEALNWCIEALRQHD